MDENDAPPGGAPRTVIRARHPDDLDRCVALLATVHTAEGYPTRWPADPHTWLTPEPLLAAWVAEGDGGLLGHVALCAASGDAAAPLWSAAAGLPVDRLATVSRLFVAPRARGRGVGATLLAVAHSAACARGRRAALDVVVVGQDRNGAVALYERAGWRRIASTPAPWRLTNGEQPLMHYYLAPE